MNILKEKTTFTRTVAIPGLLVLLALSLLCALWPDRTEQALLAVQSYVYRKFSWVYTMLVSLFFIFLLVLAFGKAGNIRLGPDNSRPQYSFFSWIAMLFAAGMGIGLMYFGVAEPMSHYVHPALPTVANPAKEAMLATFFHWGLHAWAIFALMGLILAYFSFRYRLPLSIRSGLYPLLGERIKGVVGNVADTFALVSTFFGIATSMGFGVVQLNAGLVHIGLLGHTSFALQCAIIAAVSAVAILSAVAGVSRGVRRLSEANLCLAVLLVPSLFVFMWMTVFGAGAIHIDSHVAGGALSALADQPDILLFSFFGQFPMAGALCVLGIVMIAVFFVTSADSGILVMNSISSGNAPNSPKWQNAFWGVLLALISMALLYAGGLRSLQTMTLVMALPFGLIMLVLCFCLVRALHTDMLYHSSNLPYGSRNWDGSHWRERLTQILTFSQKTDIQRFFSQKVRPAFAELAAEFAGRGIDVEVNEGRRGALSVEIVIRHERIWNFRYGVAAERRSISEYLIDEENTPDVSTNKQYIPVTYYSDGRSGNDIQYLSQEEIIADVLREYERYISAVADDKKAMMYVDKGGYAIK